jgi:hypothetical protein
MIALAAIPHSPSFAIISAGSGNSFGLPRAEILGCLQVAGTLDRHSVTPSVAALQ